jgi:hypothetical protein
VVVASSVGSEIVPVVSATTVASRGGSMLTHVGAAAPRQKTK